MGKTRIAALIAIVLGGVTLLALRLFQVQVLEHEVWANEAAKIVRSGTIVPYRRGSILDAQGRVLVSDHPEYIVEFLYRDFRRGHPLGMVAHARSSLIGRPVSLAETLPQLERYARELVLLAPTALDEFGRGRGLSSASGLTAAASLAPLEDQCAERRADLRFYVQALLGMDARERRALRSAFASDTPIESFAGFVAELRGLELDTLLAELERRMHEASSDLVTLSNLIGREAADIDGSAFDALIAALDRARENVEDEAASELFKRVTGFGAGRVEAELVARNLELDWLSGILRWSEPRTRAWLERARAQWLDARDHWHLEALLAEIALAPRGAARADTLLGELALLFAPPKTVEALRENALERSGPPDWREIDALVVLDELGDLFRARAPDDEQSEGRGALPFQDAKLRELDADPPWKRIAQVELASFGEIDADVARVAELAEAWQQHADEDWNAPWIREHVRALLERWDEPLQREVARRFALLQSSAAADERSARGALLLDRERTALAAEQASYVLKDRGNRPFVIDDEPPYELVWTISRYRDRLAGFEVRVEQERVLEADAGARPSAASLLGHVAAPDMLALKRERREARELSSLRALGSRSAHEEARLRELVVRVDRPGERRGTDGIEGYFDVELSGRNGYREARGLAEFDDPDHGHTDLDLAARDGLDIVLCIDRDLQRAAEEVLAHPRADPDPAMRDDAWLRRPVGALVLITPSGDVLAAASVPTENRDVNGSGDPRDLALERSLRLYDHQPPGSVLKPFIAAWALDRLALDSNARVECAAQSGARAHYKGLHCSSSRGHGIVDLANALKVSCNCYFAWLGEQFDVEQARGALATFGFGEACGVRSLGARRGLREDSWKAFSKFEFRTPREHLMFANGLAIVQATPIQVARAYAGLATGSLPNLRLASRVGTREIEPVGRELGLSRASLDFVRAALVTVTSEPGGSGHASLAPSALGFTFAAKTGSADYKRLTEVDSADGDNPVRKHTWLAGWFPAEAPVAVLVVFEFDTLRTASHSAVWIARDFLERPELRAFLERERGSD